MVLENGPNPHKLLNFPTVGRVGGVCLIVRVGRVGGVNLIVFRITSKHRSPLDRQATLGLEILPLYQCDTPTLPV